MSFFRYLSVIIFLLILGASLPNYGDAQATDHTHEDLSIPRSSLGDLVLALKPDKDPDKMLEEKTALRAYLSERLDTPVRVIIPLSTAVITEGLTNGSIDLAYLSATGAIKALDLGVADILLAGEIDGNSYYLSYWVALNDKPYKSVEDLRGQPIAFASKTSTSGFLIPFWDIHKKGLLAKGDPPEAFFGNSNVYYGVGYVSAIERVLAGEAVAAAVSYYVLDKDKHLTKAQRARLKKVVSQGPVPTHTLAVRHSFPAKERARLKAALLALNKENPQLRDKIFTSKLIEVDAETHLQSAREALKIIDAITQ